MPRHCSAAGCCTRDTRDTRGRGISFHRLPRRDDPRRAQWLENSRRRDPAGGGRWDPSSKYIYFCSQHFESSCFELVGYRCVYRCAQHFEQSCFELLGYSTSNSPASSWSGTGVYSGYHRLKEGAVPTVFAPGPSRPPRPPKPPPERDPPRPPRGARRWRRDLPPAPPPPPVPSDVSCFPRDSKDPGPPPAGDHGGVPALPGPSGSIPETLLAATGDAAAAATPALPEGAPPTPAGPPAPPAPPSPSLFMLRLPPRAGSYIQSEHSYQVGSALLWKRRAEAALDALDKAQRQLQAGKRREHRLRLRLAELQRERRAGPEPRRSSKERLEVIGDGGGGVGGL
ncbi:THAP domain-containing protein 7 isoform X2 [Ammospiza nelsoni]|uniref:THAP domain-containing protein 7 isoform X2 n=1 Tax=Ammospiza nelsoni TaxID=2857394 RepID=UPI002869F8EF|nr:THAP domain-containing protein 7 isoform X2 [Ammospiza nelsoni]